MASYALADGTNTAIADEDGIHSGGVFTVPAAWQGRRSRLQLQTLAEIQGATLYQSLLSGAPYDGAAAQYAEDVNSLDRTNVASAPVIVAAGDQFTTSGVLGASPLSWRQVDVSAAGFKGALLNRASSGFIIGTVTTVLEWNGEVYDTHGYHSTEADTSRLTVPLGSSGLVRLSVGLEVDASGGQLSAELWKNGGYVDGLCFKADVQARALTAVSPPIAVAAGDYFEIVAFTTAASTLLAGGNSWFSIEELPPDLQYAIGLVTSNQAIPSGTAHTGGINMDEEIADQGSWFAAGDDGFTVPAGISKLRFGFSAQMNQSLGSMYASMGRNGAAASHIGPGFAQHAAMSDGLDHMHGWSGILDVSPGDVFYPIAATNAGGTAVAPPSLWWVEEYRAPADLPVVPVPGAGALTLLGDVPVVSGASAHTPKITIFHY